MNEYTKLLRAALKSTKKSVPQLEREMKANLRVDRADLITRALEAAEKRCADIYVKGNNSGNSQILAACDKIREHQMEAIERFAKLLGAEVDWPGLYHMCLYKGYSHLSAAAFVRDVCRQ